MTHTFSKFGMLAAVAAMAATAAFLMMPRLAEAAPAYVNSTGTGDDTNDNSFALAAQNHTTGNLIVVMVKYEGAATTVTVTDTAGNIYTPLTRRDAASNDLHVQMFYKENATGNASNVITYTFTASRPFKRGIVHQYSGMATASAFDQQNFGTDGGSPGKNLSTGNITTTQNDEVLVAFAGEYAPQTYTQGTNFNERVDLGTLGFGGSASEDRIVSSTGTYNATMTQANTAEWALIISSFKGAVNATPTISISQPDGSGDTVTVGDSYNITYDLADTDNVVTAAFYYDSNNSGLDGTPISGACATAAEGDDATCAWNTTGMTPGSYYVYGITNDGTGDVSAYSSGQITISAAGSGNQTISKPPNNLGLVGYWSFNDGTGTIATDFSGSGRSGTLSTSGSGLPIWTSGKRLSALDFDGTDEYVAVGSVGSNVQSVAFWIKADITTTRKILDMNGSQEIELNGSSQVTTDFTSATIYVDGSTASTVVDTGWHHVVVTTGTPVNTSAFEIGRRVASTYFDGKIDEIRLYSRVVSAAEAQSLARAGTARFTSSSKTLTQGSSLENGLVGLWSFDGKDTSWTSETTGTTADGSGSGHTGTLTNMSRGAATAIGKLGQAFNFNGSNSYVDAANAVSTAPATSCAWVKYSATSGSFSTILSSGNRFRFFVINGAGNTDNIQIYNNVGAVDSSSDTVRADAWNHVCAYIDASNHAAIYINGALSAGPTGIGGGAASETLDIGAEGGSSPMLGLIDDARFYSRVLTAAEIKQLYLLGKTKIHQ